MRRRWPPTWPVAPPLRSESHVLIRDVIMPGPGVSRYGQPCGAVLYSGQAAAAKCHPASRVCRCVASRSVVSGGAVNDMKERLCPRGLGRRAFAVAKLTKDVVDPGSFGSSSRIQIRDCSIRRLSRDCIERNLHIIRQCETSEIALLRRRVICERFRISERFEFLSEITGLRFERTLDTVRRRSSSPSRAGGVRVLVAARRGAFKTIRTRRTNHRGPARGSAHVRL